MGTGRRPFFRPPVHAAGCDFVKLPCGKCVGCRLDLAAEWGLRASHEAMVSPVSCFVTLTYAPEHLPFRGALRVSDADQFITDLRSKFRDRRIRYLLVGEYGTLSWRPHYHACLFGMWFDDARPAGKSQAGFPSFSSATLDALWGKGRCVINFLGSEVAEYAARYSLKKLGSVGDGYLREDVRTGEPYRLPGEFMRVSTHPGIGREWLERFHRDVFPHDYCVDSKGRKRPVPRYYLRVLRDWCEDDFEALKARRIEVRQGESLERFRDRLSDRLAVREAVLVDKLTHRKREAV